MLRLKSKPSLFLWVSAVAPAVLYAAYCSGVYAQDSAAPPPMPVPAADSAALPLGAPSAPLPATAVKEAIAAYLPLEVQVHSLFFTKEEIMYLHAAVNEFSRRQKGEAVQGEFNEEDFISKLAGLDSAPKARFYTYPQFFLSSIVYYSSKEWSVWINNVKLTNPAASEPIEIPVTQFKNVSEGTPEKAPMKVVSINKEKVTFEWKPLSMAKITETLSALPPGQNDARIVVDQDEKVVRFTLHANQTFSSHSMSVVEGETVPVSVNNNLGYVPPVPKTTEKNKEPENKPAAADNTKSEDDKRGLKGLIGAYENIEQQQKENP